MSVYDNLYRGVMIGYQTPNVNKKTEIVIVENRFCSLIGQGYHFYRYHILDQSDMSWYIVDIQERAVQLLSTRFENTGVNIDE